MPAPGKPWITANQVTVARLIPMPLLSWLIYRGAETGGFYHNTYMTIALIAGTIIGSTDWVDGMLARKYGPTVLGGLLDPIADKVFIAFAYVPFADNRIHLVPAVAVALMFTREFFITALRSMYELRDLSLKTSYFAKVKTWAQMQGIGVMLLFPLVGESKALTYSLIFLTSAPLVVLVVWYIVKKSFWRGSLVMVGCVAPILALHLFTSMETSLLWIMIGIVGITWASGLDYIIVGWKQLRGRGDFSRADAVRLIGGAALPGLLFAVLVRTPAPAWPVFAILAFELSVGGLDNLLSHHKRATKALAWGSRVLSVCGLLALALIIPAYADLFSYGAVAVSLVGMTAEFWQGRDYFMDKRIRDRALREQAATES